MEPLRFTKYSNECCDTVQEASEFPTDAYLVQLVRVMHLADRMNRTISVNEFETPAVLSAPLGLSIRWYQAEIQKLKESFDCDSPYSGES